MFGNQQWHFEQYNEHGPLFRSYVIHTRLIYLLPSFLFHSLNVLIYTFCFSCTNPHLGHVTYDTMYSTSPIISASPYPQSIYVVSVLISFTKFSLQFFVKEYLLHFSQNVKRFFKKYFRKSVSRYYEKVF